ncbi:Golgi SNAP receptor complex member 1-2-like isoform X3 [Primulina tabacum]|uniref:Golgi SNAP receptor complex member 1-2-like isoform X3 n=1 Tax=Primulina tabacum TaxID=48773 RepID=UPI003F59A28C
MRSSVLASSREFSGYVDASSPTVGSSRSWKSAEMEIQSLLEKLLDINDSMSRCAASATPTTSVNQKLARHRDILHEFTQEFRRIKANIISMSEHAELLSSVRDDISEYKTSGSGSPRMQLLRERAAIHGSISHIDDVISQAQATRTALGSQRTLFGDVQGKVKLLGDKFPIIRGLLGNLFYFWKKTTWFNQEKTIKGHSYPLRGYRCLYTFSYHLLAFKAKIYLFFCPKKKKEERLFEGIFHVLFFTLAIPSSGFVCVN